MHMPMSTFTRLNLARCAGMESGIGAAVGKIVGQLAPTPATLGAVIDAFAPAVWKYAEGNYYGAFCRAAGKAQRLLNGDTTKFADAVPVVQALGNHFSTYTDATMIAILGALPLAEEGTDPMRNLMAHVDAHALGALTLLDQLIHIPSVSDETTLPNPTTFDSAHAVADMMRDSGLDNVHFIETTGANPTVYGEHIVDASLPTLMFYAHHDVQPANDEEWNTSPWEGHLRDGRLYGRGSADDKAGFMAALAAIRAYRAAGIPFPVNVIFMIEGEEEIGSPNLPALLKKIPAGRKPDVVLLTDLDNPMVGVPMVSLTTRGAAFFNVELDTGSTDAAAGYNALTDLVAQFTEPDRTLSLPGFTNQPLYSPTLVRESMGNMDAAAIDSTYREAGGMFPGEAMVGDASVVHVPRLRSPFTSLQIHDIRGPQTMEKNSGIIVPWAEMKVSFRVSSNPRRALRRFKEMATKIAWPGTKLSFSDIEIGSPPVDIGDDGVVSLTMRLETAEHPVHCGGHSYVRSAISELMWITSKLAARVNTPNTRTAHTDSTEASFSPMERVLLGFNQVDVLAVGENKTKLAFRIPPGFNAEEAYTMFRAKAEAIAAHAGIGIRFDGMSIEPWAGDVEGTNAFTALFGQALEAGYGHGHIVGGSGGSIGFFDPFGKQFPDALMLGAGIEDPHTHAHGPNESLDIEDFQKAARSLAAFMLLMRRHHDTTHAM